MIACAKIMNVTIFSSSCTICRMVIKMGVNALSATPVLPGIQERPARCQA
jgi:hypothetical protein